MLKKLFMVYLGLFSTIACAKHVVIAPDCLLEHLPASYQTLAKQDGISLIATDESGYEALIDTKTAKEKPCGNFMEVSAAWAHNRASSFLSHYKTPQPLKTSFYTVNYPEQVNQLINQLDPQQMWENLKTLTRFPDRYSANNYGGPEHGIKAANWLAEQVKDMATYYQRLDVQVYPVKTTAGAGIAPQPSVIAKIGSGSGEGIVIGAHMDTLSSISEPKPGADDDGTGTVTVLEAARTLIASGMRFKKPIYFIWYAAEEIGLLGSQSVVAEFKERNIPVAAVLQMDMTGYVHDNDPAMWMFKDNVDEGLTAYLDTLIQTYIHKPVKYTACGYACSDHASWTLNGIPAAAPTESAFEKSNPARHYSDDTMDKLSLAHMTDYLKLTIAFAVELAEPES